MDEDKVNNWLRRGVEKIQSEGSSEFIVCLGSSVSKR
jgi:hypothetical protein